MTSDDLAAVPADLDILLSAPMPVTSILDALRVFHLVGFVSRDAESEAGDATATVAYVPGRGLLVETADGVATTPAEPVLTAISARLTADVHLECGDELFSAERVHADNAAEPADDVPAAEPVMADAVQLYVVGGTVSLAPDRRAELALQIESPLTVAPVAGLSASERLLIVPHTPTPTPSWPRGQRPVIGVRLAASELLVQVYSEKAARTGRMRERLASTLIPDWMGIWNPAPVMIATGDDGPASEVQRRLLDVRRGELADLGLSDDDVLAETGIDGAGLAATLTRPLDADTIADVTAALRLPPAAVDVLTGTRAAADLPGAVEIERRSIGGTIADSLLSEPAGDSLWARWRRVPHRRPALAVLLIALELALAAGIAWWGALPTTTSPWNVVLWFVAALFAIDALGDAVLFARIRRRQRASE